MVIKLKHYNKLVGEKAIQRLYESSSNLVDKSVVHINSAYYMGGVAEILDSLVLLMNDLGIRTGWRLFKGGPDFFIITKKFHNALQGEKINFSLMKKKIYLEINKINSLFTHIDHDCVIVHDPQPLPLINYYKKKQPWIWRCHIDISRPNMRVWNYLKKFVIKYDSMIISMKKFAKKINVPQNVIAPSIDPLNTKNCELSDSKINKYLKKFGIGQDKPFIAQVSRFDKWKDPAGVIKAYRQVNRKIDCRLVLLGSMAVDDPEGQEIYHNIINKIGGEKDIILISSENNILVNAVQRGAEVIIQKSIKEGFGLTVSEALWKGTPVVAGDVGGIPAQIINGRNGYLIENTQDCARKVIKIMSNSKLRRRMGKYGKEHVKKNFLITRHLQDYVDLLNKTLK